LIVSCAVAGTAVSAIHSVRNETGAVTVSLHAYGYNLNMSGRLQFDPEREAVESVALKLER